MKFDPKIHHRRSIRLKEYDYAQAGAYFITICCQDKIHRFGQIDQPETNYSATQMILNDFGRVAYNEWMKLPERFSNASLDVFQIMPNHMHGIIVLSENMAHVGAGLAPAQNVAQDNTDILRNDSRNIPVGNIIGAYKSFVSIACLELFKSTNTKANEMMGKLWQRNFYEVIIRNEQQYQQIAEYIITNPDRWKEDKFFSE